MSATTARYDGLAAWYEEFRPALSDYESEALERLLGPGDGRCLDLGCGTGVALEPLTAARLVGGRHGRLRRPAGGRPGARHGDGARLRGIPAVRRRELRRSGVDLDAHGRRRLRVGARRGGEGGACRRAVRLHRRAPVLRRAALTLLRRQGRARAARGLQSCRALRRWTGDQPGGASGAESVRRISRWASSSKPSSDGGFTIERFEEHGVDEYPFVVALRCRR